MRGKPVARLQDGQRPRITPAHAGKTSERMPCVRQIADHPRACGENTWSNILRVLDNGSPPRMRGKRRSNPYSVAPNGITPAHAGKTVRNLRRRQYDSDHPRACGENSGASSLQKPPNGSPPRMRGKQKLPAPVFSCGRITPAHAGKTLLSWSMKRPASDHPRACGENQLP